MKRVKGWKAEDIHSINAHEVIIIGDEDVVHPEYVVEMFLLLPYPMKCSLLFSLLFILVINHMIN